MRSYSASRIAFVADVHVGNHQMFGGPTVGGINRRCRLILEALAEAVEDAIQRKCDAFVVLGDLFDSHRPTPPIVAAVQRVLHRFRPHGLVFLVAGNHDKASEEAGDHALAALWPVAEIVDTEPVRIVASGSRVLLGPYRSGPAVLWIQEYLDELLSSRHSYPALLGTHVGLITSLTPPWLREAHDAVPVSMFDHTSVIAGNWHERYLLGGITQCGALVPTGFDNPSTPVDLFGSVHVWDGQAGRWGRYDVIDGPRFHIQDWPFVFADRPKEKDFYKIRVDLSNLADAQAFLASAKDLQAVIEVCKDDKALKRTMQQKAVLNSASFDEALDAYLRTQPLPEGVKLPNVYTATREYVARGRKHVG